jgi:HEAT repeat protein
LGDGRPPIHRSECADFAQLLTDLDEDVLTSAIHALGHPNIASAADLSGLARHPSAEVRHAVAFALDSHDAKARELLLKLMTDEDASVRD